MDSESSFEVTDHHDEGPLNEIKRFGRRSGLCPLTPILMGEIPEPILPDL